MSAWRGTAPTRVSRSVAVGLACLALVPLPALAAGRDPDCASEAVCKRSDSPPADDWFRHGLEALAERDGAIAVCALDKATQLDPKEDGHNLTTFVKSMTGGVKLLPRECTLSSAPLDKKKYFPRLYLAKAHLEMALRSADAEKREHCGKALELLASSREKAPQAKVLQQVERRERIDRDLKDSRCCELLPDHAQCSAK